MAEKAHGKSAPIAAPTQGVALTVEAQKKYSVQSYVKAPTIEGVQIKDVPSFVDDGAILWNWVV